MGEDKLKVFISAYACEPDLGSEIGVGWHWVLEMSKYFELWVLTRKSNKESIKNWLKQNKPDNTIHFIYYDLPPALRFWKKGLRGVRTYYVLWQKLTNSTVRETMKKNDIKIFHHLTYGNALWPVSGYGQKQFFVWGPIGIGDVIPRDFSKHYTLKDRLTEWARRMVRRTLPFNKGFKRRYKNAGLIFCKTETALNQIPDSYQQKAVVFTDVAVENIDTSEYENSKNDASEPTKYLAVGRLEGWRGFDLLIEAFSKAVKKNNDIHLEILGEGSDRDRLEKLISARELSSYITLAGQVPMEEYYKRMAECDVVLNPCLKEGAVTAAFDSMSFAKPLICIETGGYTRHFNNDCAIIIACTNRKKVIAKMAEGIVDLTDKNLRDQMGLRAKEIGNEYNWEDKGKKIYEHIDKAFTQRNK